MQRKILIIPVLVIITVILLAQGAPQQPQQLPQTMKVGIQKAAIYKKPTAVSDVVAVLTYGTELQILELQKGWYKVQYQNKIAYIHKNAVDKPERLLDLEKGPTGEVTKVAETAAAKGFNDKIEEQYKKDNKLDEQFKLLDEQIMGRPDYKKDPQKLVEHIREFQKKGRLD